MISELPINIENLLNKSRFENSRVEFKASWNEKTKESILRTICAFANDILNLNGGYIVIGVEEENGKTILPPKGIDENCNIDKIKKEILGGCVSGISPQYFPTIYVEKYEEKTLLIISAFAGDNKPYDAFRRDNKTRAYWIRQDSSTIEAKDDLQNQLLEQTARIPFDDRRYSNINKEIKNIHDIDQNLVRKYLSKIGSKLADKELYPNINEIYQKLNLTVKVNAHEEPRNIALLFFNDNPHDFFPGAYTEVTIFKNEGDDNEEKKFEGPLDRQIEEVLDYIKMVTGQLKRKEQFEAKTKNIVAYPFPAYEEAIVNAIYHRGYSIEEPVKVYIYPDKMEIISYPGPVQGITKEDFYPHHTIPPVRARNRRIADFLRELNLAEKKGTGIPKIKREMENNSSKAPLFDFDEPGRNYFKVTLPLHPQFKNISKLVEQAYEKAKEESSFTTIKLSKKELTFLHLSDLHFVAQKEGNGDIQSFNQDVVIKSMLEMISELFYKGEKPDFIIITGDITFSGKEEEFRRAGEFCRELLQVTDLTAKQLFLVPGNHDADWNEIKSNHVKWWYGFNNEDDVSGVMEEEGALSVILKKFDNFTKFADEVLERAAYEKEKYFTTESVNVEIDDKTFTINLLGLNSAVFARKDENDKNTQMMAFGLPQITKAIDSINEGYLTLAYFHHPFQAFHETEKTPLSILKRRADIILTGHLHDPQNSFVRDSTGESLIIGSGACFEKRTTENSFNMVKIDTVTGEGTVQFYKYLKDPDKWKKDTDRNPERETGDFPFTIESFIKKPLFTQEEIEEEKKEEQRERKTTVNYIIPAPRPFFTGRKKEMEYFKGMFNHSSLITLEGIGGIGKTEFAAKCIEQFLPVDKVVWIDIAEINNLDSVIALSGYEDLLKINDLTEIAKFSGFSDLIDEAGKLFFIDNYQDVEDPAFGRFFKYVERRLKKAKFILISREHPKIPGIFLPSLRLEGLGEDTFDYALQVKEYSHISVSEEDIKKVCELVQGHPLAIELSLQLLGYGEKSEKVIENIVSFKDGNEDLSDRLLAEVFDHPKSDKDEKLFICQFSIFQRNVTREALEKIIEVNDLQNTIRTLVDKLMITYQDGQFKTHPLIRAFCYDRLEGKEKFHLKAANFFISQRKEKIEISREERVYYHLNKSNSFQKTEDYIEQQGESLLKEGFNQFLKKILDHLKECRHYLLKFDLLYGEITQIGGDWDKACDIFKHLIDTGSDEEIKAKGLIKLGQMYWRKGDYEEGKIIFAEAITICKEIKYQEGEGRALHGLGLVYGGLDDLDSSERYYKDALTIQKKINDDVGIAISLHDIGAVLDKIGKPEEALEKVQQSLEIRRKINDKGGIAISLVSLGSIQCDKKEYRKALTSCNESLKISKELGDKSLIGYGLSAIGSVLNEQGDGKSALKNYNQSLEIFKKFGKKPRIANVLYHIGAIHFKNKNYNIALEKAIHSLAIDNQLGKNTFEIKKSIFLIKKKLKADFFKVFAEAQNKLPDELKKHVDISEWEIKHLERTDKVGRNDPCPCGSGKKFKKCCGKG